MRNKTLVYAVLILGLVAPSISVALGDTFTYNLSYRFENTGDEPYILEQEDYTLPLFINSSSQSVTLTEPSTSYSAEVIDLDGNLGAIMDVDSTLSPGEVLEFSVVYEIESDAEDKPAISLDDAEGYGSIPLSLVNMYTSHTETFTVDDPLIGETALRAAKEDPTVLGTVVNLLDYVTKNTTYRNFETPRYPLDTLNENLGDCDDQSILLISMARSLGIPAYLKVGVIIHPNIADTDVTWEGHLENDAEGVGWHGWAMVYIPPWGWVPIDLTLVQEDNGLDYILNSPEYESNIIEAINVVNQAYIGNTIATRERIIASDLYVTIVDNAEQTYGGGSNRSTYILLGLGVAMSAAIIMLFRSTNSD